MPMNMGTRFSLFLAGAVVAAAQISSPLVAPARIPDYQAITAGERIHWMFSKGMGPSALAAAAVTTALETSTDSPEEYGSHWSGYAKRNALQLSARATSSVMEAGLGSLWGEDPRYFRTSGKPAMSRVSNVVRMAFMAHDRNGHEMPAYARFVAVPGSILLTNMWRPDSQTQTRDTVNRISFTFMTRILGNAVSEFGPDLRNRFSKKKNVAAVDTTPAKVIVP
jgi:hypothetical protein